MGWTMDNQKLTGKNYWDAMFKATSQDKDLPTASGGLISRLYHRYFRNVEHGYSKYLLFDVIFRKYFPTGEQKIIEIGSAPGVNLVTIHNKFGYIPFGAEYIEAGVKANRQLFENHGLNPENVIHSDFFDDDFQNKYAGYFDIVMSHGFIEHFTDTKDVVDKHLNLLKPNGFLCITIPNFRGLNYLIVSFFVRHTIKAHNISIMKKRNFIALFDLNKVDIVKCRFIGTFSFNLIYGTNKGPFKLKLMYACLKIQKIIDGALYMFFKKGGIDSFLFSPSLMMICRKKEFKPADSEPSSDN